MRRVERAQRHERGRERQLDGDRPAAPPPERPRQKRHGHAIDDRRPQEFQRIGEPDIGEEADRGQRDVRLYEPDGEGRSGQGQRQAAREAHAQDRQHAPVAIDGERAEPATQLDVASFDYALRCASGIRSG